MAGVRSPAIERSSFVHIGRDAGVVWDYVSDFANTPTWRTAVTSIEPPDVLEVGARFSGTTRLLGRDWHWGLRVTEVDRGRRLRYDVVEGVVKLFVTYDLEPDPDGTWFAMAGGLNGVGFVGRLLRPFAAPVLRRETAAHLAKLKRILDQ